MKDEQHYKALAKMLSGYEKGNGMTETARKCEEHKKTKIHETREDLSKNKAIIVDLNLTGQNIVLGQSRAGARTNEGSEVV